MEEWQPDKEMYLKPDSEKYIKQDIEKYFKPEGQQQEAVLNQGGNRYLDPEPSPLADDYESEDDLMPEMENLEPGTSHPLTYFYLFTYIIHK